MKVVNFFLMLTFVAIFFSGCKSDADLDDLVNKKTHQQKSETTSDDEEDDQD